MDSDSKGKEDEALKELQEHFKQRMDLKLWENESVFRRFLKAADFNADLAETMLKKHLEWRQKYDVDNIQNVKLPEVLEKYVPMTFLGYDKEGCAIRYMPSGTIDWVGLFLSVKLEDMKKLIIKISEEDMEKMKERNKKVSKSMNKSIYIHNLENFSFAQATDKNVILNSITLFNLYIENYPEVLKNIFVINATPNFSFIFAIIKRCLPYSILNKIKVYSDESWKKDFLEVIDADVLPAFLGGTKTDPDDDPLCKTFINHGGPVPETYYIHKSKRSLASLPGVESMMLPSASFQEVKLEVKKSGSYLEWEFETKSRDIGFGLFLQEIDGEENNIELIPIQRINTDEYAETGLYLCEKEGTYIIVFDNTYSLVRSKEIFYRIKIVSPEEQKQEP